MEVSCLSRLAIEIFKTLKSLNPDFMFTYFKKGSHFARRKNDLVIDKQLHVIRSRNLIRFNFAKIADICAS